MADKPTDEQIFERAKEIAEARGLSIADAMLEAQRQLVPPEVQDATVLEVTLVLKPKVAKWYQEQFGGHPDYTMEERLGVWLAQFMTQQRGRMLAETRPSAKIEAEGVVTMRRSAFMEQAPQG